jgi:hypothetical protein
MSNHDAENALRDSLVNQQLILRNFSGEEKMHANWNGSEIALDGPRWRTLGEVVVDSMKVKGHRLVMSCSRHVLLKDKDGKIEPYAIPSKMEIDVELGGADPTVVLPRLKDALFYSSLNEALAALPKEVRNRVPGSADMDPFNPVKVADPPKPMCDCAAQDKTGCAARAVTTQGMVPPVVVKQNNPQLTDESRRAGNLDAHVDVGFTVAKDGQPQDVWIVKPAGMGLDEAAAKSVLKYLFRPAMCHDKPVAVYLMVDVRFQRY